LRFAQLPSDALRPFRYLGIFFIVIGSKLPVIKGGSENLFMVVNVKPKREIESPRKINARGATKCDESLYDNL